MTGRQAGVQMADAYAVSTTAESKALVVAAYERPIWITKGYKDDEIDTFTNAAFMACIKAYP